MGAMIPVEIDDFSRFQLTRQNSRLRRYVAFYIPIRTTLVIWDILAHEKAWLQIFVLCSLQCNQARLPVGSNLCGLSGQEARGGQILQCYAFPCAQKLVQLIYAMEKSRQPYNSIA